MDSFRTCGTCNLSKSEANTNYTTGFGKTNDLATEDELDTLIDNCPTCGQIPPSDTTAEDAVECPRCRTIVEVDR